jgi:hypothetical protein
MTEQEKLLRESIRHMIRHVKQRKLNEENELRTVIRKFMDHEIKDLMNEAAVADVDPTPNKSTGINVLEELLKKIIPVLETDYKSLTTNKEQRDSFRSHIINAVVNTLTPARVNTDAAADASELQEQDIEVSVDDAGDDDLGLDDKFIDIRTDAEISADDEEEEEDPRDTFGAGVDGDETGRNMAYQCFKKIEGNIIDAYELLSDDEDQELFYDYLIANLKLYFDKFEGELAVDVEEPTNQAYDTAKTDTAAETEIPSDSMGLQEYIDSL